MEQYNYTTCGQTESYLEIQADSQSMGDPTTLNKMHATGMV